jgi:arginyl-tRNA--protein-N-Asp/Glu arginylyltransferase
MADQFAWDYENPKLKLGYKSIRSECARYKRLGYQYYYLGEVCDYKQQLQGFELVQRPHT